MPVFLLLILWKFSKGSLLLIIFRVVLFCFSWEWKRVVVGAFSWHVD